MSFNLINSFSETVSENAKRISKQRKSIGLGNLRIINQVHNFVSMTLYYTDWKHVTTFEYISRQKRKIEEDEISKVEEKHTLNKDIRTVDCGSPEVSVKSEMRESNASLEVLVVVVIPLFLIWYSLRQRPLPNSPHGSF